METPLIELVLFSDKRKNLLLLLRNGPMTLEEIKKSLGVSSATVLPHIKTLRDGQLLAREKEIYSLTPLGSAIVERIRDLVDTLEVLETDFEYWRNHKLESIPSQFLLRINELKHCIFSMPTDQNHLFDPHREFVENIASSRSLKGISPIFHPSYPELFLNFAQKGMDVSILMTRPVFERIEKEFRAEVERFVKLENAHFYVYGEEITFAYVVTDRFLSLTLFYRDGKYDHKQDLLSFEPEALSWGEELFEYYRSMSEEISSP